MHIENIDRDGVLLVKPLDKSIEANSRMRKNYLRASKLIGKVILFAFFYFL